MIDSIKIDLLNRQQAWAAIKSQLFPFLAEALQAGKRYTLTVKDETRSNEQNRLQWPLLQCFADQLEWPINGRMEKITADDWKDILSAAFRRESVRIAMGIDGGMVMLGQRTSKMTKAEFSEWIEFLMATAAQRGVQIENNSHMP